ncbi:MAG TPA: hypothetical protein VGN18_05165 [Jatrophihabitans sp.]|jgi:hypothetical protein|uniref:hypothetical protein n=1 Tax=Jatrophihabitans sp. TaxID=1932789 RepID=UPI002E0AC121|nr:hypothetical protein [Jatrophihabitans sp.]
MTVVTVAGHGGWDRQELASRGEANWISAARIPVYFFTENMKSMWGMAKKGGALGEADMLATADAADLMELVNQGMYSRKVDAGSGCLNYVVGDDETSDDLTAGDGVVLHHGGEYSLQNLMDTYTDATAIFWCCCSAIMLNDAGGSELGVDEGQHVFDKNTGEWLDANAGDQRDWKGVSGDFTPQGVQQCDATCAECNGRCRLGTEHHGVYAHQCDQGHTFNDDQAGLGIAQLHGDQPGEQATSWMDDPDWKNFIERLVTSDAATSRQMWDELGFDTQAQLRQNDRVATWAGTAGV